MYDLIILGCGPAGEKAAAQAAFFGKRVAVIDPGPIGGACVHTGTLPSKSLREAALVLSGARALDLSAVQVAVDRRARLADLLAHKAAVTAAEQARMERNLERHGVTLLLGRGRIAGAHAVVYSPRDGGEEQTLQAEVILVATGTHPFRPAALPFDHPRVWDSDEVVEMDHLPATLLVYGAGVIGCEYASIFAALGVQVTLVEPRDTILGFLDAAITGELLGAFGHAGIEVLKEHTLGDVAPDDDGITLTLHGPGGETSRRFEQLLFAAGRSGNTAGLGLETVGLQPNRRGQLDVDGRYHTGAAQIYAVGDVIGFPALASTSMEQGRIAVCHAFDFPYKKELATLLPYGIYTIPEVSMVGESSASLQAVGRDFEIGVARFADNARAHLHGDADGLLQLVFCPQTRKLLGVHIVGQGASELVHIGMMAIQLGGTIDGFIDAVFNFPTLSELYKYAAYDGLGRLARRR